MDSRRREESTWLTLGKASALLGVHPTTLRSWVNAGLVHAFLTPGGHRRFELAELRAFLERRRANGPIALPLPAADRTLQQVRQQLTAGPLANEPWHQRMSDGQRTEFRQTGARLLGLLLQYVSRKDSSGQFLSEACAIGREYGSEFAKANLSVTQLTQAFLFFRRTITGVTFPNAISAPDVEGARLFERLGEFMDALLLATLEAYEQGRPAPQPPLRQRRKRAALAGPTRTSTD